MYLSLMKHKPFLEHVSPRRGCMARRFLYTQIFVFPDIKLKYYFVGNVFDISDLYFVLIAPAECQVSFCNKVSYRSVPL